MVTTLLLVAGCHSSRNIGTSPTPREQEHDYTVMTFTGTANGLSVSGQVRMDRDRVIWCSVNKFIEMGRAMATPDSVWVRIPLMNRYEQKDYNDLSRMAGMPLSFGYLQETLESPDAEQRITTLAKRFGLDIQIRITRKEKAETLTFPFTK